VSNAGRFLQIVAAVGDLVICRCTGWNISCWYRYKEKMDQKPSKTCRNRSFVGRA
jgi:hypothetical protein